jgi:hypothetical protein
VFSDGHGHLKRENSKKNKQINYKGGIFSPFFFGGTSFVFLTHFNIFTNMGRPKKLEEDKKVKYGISIDRSIFEKMKDEHKSVSHFIQTLVKEYYEKKRL